MKKYQITQASVPKGVIDLGVGQPQVELLPLKKIKRAADHQLSEANPEILQYGAQQGSDRLRVALAAFLSDACGLRMDREEILITAGISQALDLICTLFVKPGDTIIVEEPSYFLALRIFADHHLNVVGAPMDRNGLIVEGLEARVKKYRPKLVYTIPVFHNPAGVTLSEKRREALIRLSNQYDFLVVADEVYQLLSYGEKPPPPMAAFKGAEGVVSLGSFSKILAPGLRLGWMQADKKILERVSMCGLLDSGGGSNPFTAGIVASVIDLGLQKEILDGFKDTYKRRKAFFGKRLQERIPELDFRIPEGGFFIWARFKDGRDAGKLLVAAKQQRVGFQPGCRFSSVQGFNDYLRLCFSYYNRDDLEKGVARLAKAIAG
ncbi:MAG: PLP-dependent aminotransferase family protein [Deltaproteobacteria bacterium]|nr:PLP-dependent aminotransferase family protein [Deltaproteobacteria bacterium]